MDTLKLLQLVPYLISLAISIGIMLYALRRTHIAGAFALTILALGESLYVGGYIFELLGTTIPAKVFWDDFQFLGSLAFPTGMFLFAIEYTRQQTSHSRRTLFLLLIAPIVTMTVTYTDQFHHLIRSNIQLMEAPPFGELSYDFEIASYLVALYVYALNLVSMWIFIRGILKLPALYRKQALTVMLGLLVPIAGSILSIAGITIGQHRDTTPFTFGVCNIIVAIALFRFALLDVVPIAYSKLIENMPDALFVIDNRHRIVDLNPAARALFGTTNQDVEGKPATKVLANWQSLLDGLQSSELSRYQLESQINAQTVYLDATLTQLRSERGEALGHLIVARDITSRKLTEDAERQQRIFAEALIEITKALNSTLNLDDVLECVLENIDKVIPYSRAEISLIRDGDVIIVGTRNHDIERSGMKLGFLGRVENLTITKIVNETHKPFLVSDTAALINDPVLSNSNLARTTWVKSFIGVPILTGNTLTGFISLGYDQAGFYHEGFVPRIEAFAAQVAIALENARLYDMAQTMAATEERQRLARDIHDSVSQTLFASKTIAELIHKGISDGRQDLTTYSEQLIKLNKGAMSELRTMMLELRPNALEQTDIGTLLRLLADTFTGNTQVPVEVAAPDKLFLPRDMQIAYYRVAQEALNNVTRYANASQVKLTLTQDGDCVAMHIIDNGIGFDPEKVSSERLGIKLMNEHAANIDSVLIIKSAVGKGTEVILSGS